MNKFLFVIVSVFVGSPLLCVIYVMFFYDDSEEQRIGEQNRIYDETHPPISDEEYLALCDSSIDPDVALEVRGLLADVAGIDREIIYPDARLVSDLGLY